MPAEAMKARIRQINSRMLVTLYQESADLA